MKNIGGMGVAQNQGGTPVATALVAIVAGAEGDGMLGHDRGRTSQRQGLAQLLSITDDILLDCQVAPSRKRRGDQYGDDGHHQQHFQKCRAALVAMKARGSAGVSHDLVRW